jgi:hypothetical protein
MRTLDLMLLERIRQVRIFGIIAALVAGQACMVA